jgi:hypothetical protein
MSTACPGINRDGSKCRAKPFGGKPTCIWHDPARQDQLAEARRRGGFNSSAEARALKALQELPALTNVNDVLKVAMMKVLAGRMQPKVANALAALAARIESLSITTEYGDAIETERDELARLRQVKQA